MSVLDDAIAASGGLDLWSRLSRFSVSMSIGGALFERKGKGGALSKVVAEGMLHEQFLKFSGFTAPDKYAIYRPGRVSVETADGTPLESRDNPQASFAGHTDATPWDNLHLAYFAGYANWYYLTVPFLLKDPDVRVEDAGEWEEDGQTWQRLSVRFPDRIATHSPEQTFYFDRAGLQRRMDYQALDAGGAHLAHYTWAHKKYSGIVMPTRRRAFRIGQGGRLIKSPVAVDIEIFDAAFS
jgi:hypothetical protein